MTVNPVEQEPDIWDSSFEGKRVVIGLGNVFMKHDGVGIQVAKELRHRDHGVGVLVFECQVLELSLLWQFRGASKVIVADALESGGYAGTVSTCTMAPREDSLFELPSLHALQLHDMFDLASQAAMLPCPVTIVSVEPKDCSPRESVTCDLTAAVPRAAEAVNEELHHPEWMDETKKGTSNPIAQSHQRSWRRPRR